MNEYISTVGRITAEVEWTAHNEFRLAIEHNGKPVMLTHWQNEASIMVYSRTQLEMTLKAALDITVAQAIMEESTHCSWMDGFQYNKGGDPRKPHAITRK